MSKINLQNFLKINNSLLQTIAQMNKLIIYKTLHHKKRRVSQGMLLFCQKQKIHFIHSLHFQGLIKHLILETKQLRLTIIFIEVIEAMIFMMDNKIYYLLKVLINNNMRLHLQENNNCIKTKDLILETNNTNKLKFSISNNLSLQSINIHQKDKIINRITILHLLRFKKQI